MLVHNGGGVYLFALRWCIVACQARPFAGFAGMPNHSSNEIAVHRRSVGDSMVWRKSPERPKPL